MFKRSKLIQIKMQAFKHLQTAHTEFGVEDLNNKCVQEVDLQLRTPK